MTSISIPPYVYQEKISQSSLLQGDILKVDGQFGAYFEEFYPKIAYKEQDKEKYVMVLTQSCDLVKTAKRKPKLTHINVCLIKSLKYVIQKLAIDEIKPVSVAEQRLMQRSALDELKDKLSKLLNNSDQKTYFFLPKSEPFTEDMVAILPLSFSFRVDHYDLLLQNRVLGLKQEFQAKVGHIISQLYGRIGTSDLFDWEWDDKKTRNYIKILLGDLNLSQVPDESFIKYIQENFNRSDSPSIETLIQECQILKNEQSFKPLKNEIMKHTRNSIIRLFEDKNKIESLSKMSKPDLSKEIAKILKLSPENP